MGEDREPDTRDLKAEIKQRAAQARRLMNAFAGTDLQARLDDAGIKTLVIVGLTTDHCISTTTRMAGNLGYNTFLVADAVATFNKKGIDGQNYPAELIHETALASLNNEFATIINSDAVKQSIATGISPVFKQP